MIVGQRRPLAVHRVPGGPEPAGGLAEEADGSFAGNPWRGQPASEIGELRGNPPRLQESARMARLIEFSAEVDETVPLSMDDRRHLCRGCRGKGEAGEKLRPHHNRRGGRHRDPCVPRNP
jgi:hypothetical protein